MKTGFCVLLIAFLLSVTTVYAQLGSDTLLLEAVEIKSVPLEKYGLGTRIQTFDQEQLRIFPSSNLSDLLSRQAGVYIKSYGPGMLSSISLRGTGAGHTGVFWNGININYPSLGQSDFALLPLVGVDQVAIHYGATGALYGTDAIGGAIHLSQKSNFKQGSQIRLDQMLGSFGRMRSSVNYRWSNDQWSISTLIDRLAAENDFEYINTAKIGRPKERLDHGAISQYNVQQSIAWKPGALSQISVNAWYTTTDRELQPTMLSNTKDTQADQNLRLMADYSLMSDNHFWQIKFAYLSDQLLYNESDDSKTKQHIIKLEDDWSIADKLSIKYGALYNYVTADLSAYEEEESRTDLFASARWQPISSFILVGSLRQALVDDWTIPLTPAVNATWSPDFLQDKGFSLRASWARSFKTPTLNDRYWRPGGNPDLLAEDGISYEAGVDFSKKRKNSSWSASLTVFDMLVDNWILWQPKGSFWSPENIQKVHSSGVEMSISVTQRLANFVLDQSLQYHLNRTVNLSNTERRDLPYTPRHTGALLQKINFNSWQAIINHQYTGERFITADNAQMLPAFYELNLGLSYQFSWNGTKIIAQANVHNVSNVMYQNMNLRAMPGRNYTFNLTIEL